WHPNSPGRVSRIDTATLRRCPKGVKERPTAPPSSSIRERPRSGRLNFECLFSETLAYDGSWPGQRPSSLNASDVIVDGRSSDPLLPVVLLKNGLSQTSLNGYARSLAGFGPCMF